MEQPFYVGQKVVVLLSGEYCKKGDIVIVKGCFLCAGCKRWQVAVSIPNPFERPYYRCTCGVMVEDFNKSHMGADAKYFAPLHPAHEDITAQLAKESVEERLDVVKVKEIVNN